MFKRGALAERASSKPTEDKHRRLRVLDRLAILSVVCCMAMLFLPDDGLSARLAVVRRPDALRVSPAAGYPWTVQYSKTGPFVLRDGYIVRQSETWSALGFTLWKARSGARTGWDLWIPLYPFIGLAALFALVRFVRYEPAALRTPPLPLQPSPLQVDAASPPPSISPVKVLDYQRPSTVALSFWSLTPGRALGISVAIHVLVFTLYAPTLDGGAIMIRCLVESATYWIFTLVIVLRHRLKLTEGDLHWIAWGFPVMLLCELARIKS